MWCPHTGMAPPVGISQHTNINDNNSLAVATYVCLGHFWWPLANRVPWETTNDTPGTLVSLWTSKRGLKISVVAVLVGPIF